MSNTWCTAISVQFDLQGKIIISVIAWFWKQFGIYESFKLPHSWSSPKIFVTFLKSSEVFGSLRVITGSSPRSSEYLGGLSADIRNLRISLEIFVVICNYEPWDLFFLYVFQIVEHVDRLFHNSFERSCKIFSWLSVLFSRVILLHSAFNLIFIR